MELVVIRKLAVSASFVLFVSGTAVAQTPSQDKARTEDLVRHAVERYTENLQQAAAQGAQTPGPSIAVVGAVNTPLTLDEAVRRATESNLDIAVERLNPQTFDLTLAGLYAVYHPTATSRYGRNDNVRLPTNLLNTGAHNISTMT